MADQGPLRSTTRALQTKRWNIIISQYGLASRIAAEISTTDLYHVARTTKVAWANIWEVRENWHRLHVRTHCDGSGVKERKSKLPENAPVECAAWHLDCDKLHERACWRCGCVVCNECRTHLLYQTLFEKWFPSETALGPEMACSPVVLQELAPFQALGTVRPMLKDRNGRRTEPSQFPQHPTAHFCGPDCTTKVNRIAHDCQRFSSNLLLGGIHDLSIEGFMVSASKIRFAINADLGKRRITGMSYEYFSHPGEFTPAVEARKLYLCVKCFRQPWNAVHPGTPIQMCSCTLKKHFVDRWLCLKCCKFETERDERWYKMINKVLIQLPLSDRYGGSNEEKWPPVIPRSCCCGTDFD